MRIFSEVCKQEGYLQQFDNYYRVRHCQGKVEYRKSNFYYHQQSRSYIKALILSNETSIAGKTLIKVGPNGFAETGKVGIQPKIEHQTELKADLEQKEQNLSVRDSPSLVWGRPAKSVVERPRGFNSHIPRHNSHTPLFVDYLKQHIREVTVPSYLKRLELLGKVGNLDNPEQIKTLICTYQATESFKELLTNAYDYYVKFYGYSWVKPRFTREDKPFFLPTETEIEQLISKSRLKMSVFLQLLKETGADSGEVWKLRWIDFNVENCTVALTPTKNHNARTLKISCHCASRLLSLPRRNERVFACKDLDDFRRRYEDMKNALAVKLLNPRLKEVAFRSFRHWKATTEYRRTKDILHVKWLLGHKRLENTLVYTHLVPLESCSYVCKVAHSLEEAAALIEEGFEFVTEMEGVKLFRKPK